MRSDSTNISYIREIELIFKWPEHGRRQTWWDHILCPKIACTFSTINEQFTQLNGFRPVKFINLCQEQRIWSWENLEESINQYSFNGLIIYIRWQNATHLHIHKSPLTIQDWTSLKTEASSLKYSSKNCQMRRIIGYSLHTNSLDCCQRTVNQGMWYMYSVNRRRTSIESCGTEQIKTVGAGVNWFIRTDRAQWWR